MITMLTWRGKGMVSLGHEKERDGYDALMTSFLGLFTTGPEFPCGRLLLLLLFALHVHGGGRRVWQEKQPTFIPRTYIHHARTFAHHSLLFSLSLTLSPFHYLFISLILPLLLL